MKTNKELICKDEVFQIIGAALDVYNNLGCGFLEAVYHEALEIEFSNRKIPYHSEVELPIQYKSVRLKKKYVVDFLVYKQVIVEIKALNALSSVDEAQILNYLKASGYQVGVLINFGGDKLEWKRRVLTRQDSTRSTSL